MSKSQVLQSFRHLLRTQLKTFHGDMPMIKSMAHTSLGIFHLILIFFLDARAFTRSEYLKNVAEQDPSKLQKLVSAANEAAEIIRKNIVQGVKKETSETKNTDVYGKIFLINDSGLK